MKVYPKQAAGLVESVLNSLFDTSTPFTLKDAYGEEITFIKNGDSRWNASNDTEVTEFAFNRIEGNIPFSIEMGALSACFAPNVEVDDHCGCHGCVCGDG